MTNNKTDKTDKTDKKPPVTAKEATHIIYKRQTGPRSYERKEGVFIIERNHRIKIAETADDIETGSDPVIPAHLAADIVEAGHAVYFASPSAPEGTVKETTKEAALPPTVTPSAPAPDSFPALLIPVPSAQEPAKEG